VCSVGAVVARRACSVMRLSTLVGNWYVEHGGVYSFVPFLYT